LSVQTLKFLIAASLIVSGAGIVLILGTWLPWL